LLVFFIIFSYHRLLLFIDNNTYKNAIVLGIFVGLIPNAHVFGLLNVGSIYLTLGVVFLLAKSKAERMLLLKQIALAGVISLVVFLPVVQISSVCLRRSLTGFRPRAWRESNGFYRLVGEIRNVEHYFYRLGFDLLYFLTVLLVSKAGC
jgi:hypothetical protein